VTVDTLDYESLARFRYILRRFLAFSAKQARAAGLEPQQHQLLLALSGLPLETDPTIGALADDLLIRHHSAVELVNRMEKKGLVRRERAGTDRRMALVKVTARGKKLLRRLALAHRDELRSAGPALVSALDQVLTGRSVSR
jgi:DNA-binding MarR family transcriptional regulator